MNHWNRTDFHYPSDKTIHRLFEEQAARTPDAIAVVHETLCLTYGELNDRSNQLAREIRNKYAVRTGVQMVADTMICLYVDRGIEMVIGMFGIFKAGGAYVPIDVNYPPERVNYLIEDTNAQLVLSQRKLSSKIAAETIYIDYNEQLYQQLDRSNLSGSCSSNDLAYVIYTSGTTGKPKGVLVEHTSVVNLVYGQEQLFKLSPSIRMLQFASIVFDASVWEIFYPLVYGGQVYIVPTSARRDTYALTDFIEKHHINIAFLTPSVLAAMPDKRLGLAGLKTLIVGGEVCAQTVIDKWSTGRQLVHAYGATECTVYTTMHFFDSSNLTNFNIGSPLPNMKVYILDQNLKPVPVGMEGELYIGGVGVARGYLRLESLTRERFVKPPLSTNEELNHNCPKLYKTGDLASWLPNGELKYIGRNDEQVKIRGQRLELGEVEYALGSVDGIAQASVAAREHGVNKGQKILIGYYVLDKSFVPTNDSEILTAWEKVYDREYAKPLALSSIEEDFTAWNSYITGKPIPLTDMYAWRDAILRIIKNLNPQHVLEIGVGSGILMYPLLGSVSRYVGIDLSRYVVERHKDNLSGKGYSVEFHHLKANQLDQLRNSGQFDTIIMNSVCQHFPSIMYFEKVLESALHLLCDGGTLFLGDVCNYDLYEDLIREKFAYRGIQFNQNDVEQALIKEYDLLISPNYFSYIREKFSNTEIEIIWRENDYDNELSRYRYDVLINRLDKKEKKVETDHLKRADKHFNIPFLSQLGKDAILNRLAKSLPAYMIPDALIQMSSFPVTINGKIDKKLLPDPVFGLLEDYVQPMTDVEITVSNIWREVLCLERVGIQDDFFRLGGNSILATQASHRMSKVLRSEIKVSKVFELKTISAILDDMSASGDESETIEKEF